MTSSDLTALEPTNALTPASEEIALLREKLDESVEQIQSLKHRIEWFEKQLFGRKSEKRVIENPDQLDLLGEPVKTLAAPEDNVTITYQRGKAKKQQPEDCATDAGLRFNDNVPVEVIEVTAPELDGPEADQYEVIDTRITHKLAQRPASYVVLQYETPVLKRKGEQTLITTPMPDQVFENSIADVSVLAGLLVDKFLYHLPLYRQHQRMQHAGITLSRATLTNWAKRAIEMFRLIVGAQLKHMLEGKVLAMDETGIKAGRKGKGKMNNAWFWPLYGEDDEIVFTYSESRGRRHIENTLKSQFSGTLISDNPGHYPRPMLDTHPQTVCRRAKPGSRCSSRNSCTDRQAVCNRKTHTGK
jgi:transposase